MKPFYRYKAVLGLGLLCLAVTACVTPRYKSPANLVTEASFRGSVPGDSATLARIDWRTYYTDPHLQALIREALDSNLNLRISIRQTEEARAYFRQNRLAFFPTLALQAQAGLADPSRQSSSAVPSYVKTPVEQYLFGASSSWEIDIWGRLRSAKRAAYANLLSQEATRNAVLTQLIADVATGYYQLLMLDAQRRITEETIRNYTEYLETVKSLKESAQANEVAVQQAYAQLYGAKAYLPDLEAAVQVTENYLNLLMGRSAGPIVRAEDFDIDAVRESNLTGVPAQLLQYRPDVMAAEFSLRAAHERFNVAKAAMYPALTISASAGSESMKFKQWFRFDSPTSLFWNAVAGLTQPVFNGRALRTQKEVAQLQRDEAFLGFRLTFLNAVSEVSNALLKCGTSTQKALYQKQQYEALSNAYEYSKLLLVRGYATYLDVLAAQTPLFNTRLALYETYYNAVQQKIELYRALGGGWTVSGPEV